MEECFEDIKMHMDELQLKMDELEEEFRKLSCCDKFCLLIINKYLEWKQSIRKMLKQS
jgi:hypothetical protein